MSTILNTLKKLEEEKSILEKNIDLKGLVLQGQESAYPQVERQAPRNWGLILGLIFGGALLGGLAFFFFLSPEPTQPRTDNARLLNKPPAMPEVKKPRVSSNPGIPLAGIPETVPVSMDDPFMDEDFFGPEEEFPLMLEDAPVSEVEEPEPEGSAEIREIENLIQTATSPSEMESQSLEEQVSALSGVQHIPGLKLKGIIFFSPDNPANHVFVATNEESNRKLQVGDILLGASLESIEAQKAVFSYEGQLVEAPIGK